MSVGSFVDAGNSDGRQRWAALDSKHERLVDTSDPLLRELNRDRTDRDRPQQPVGQ
ncbi:MAG TPA: hypothetical protein VNF47_18015 [Streptosporangiaceae bacterium]|nr:hypothetical protein [Streptosporangiaceae bacterium]